MTKRFLYFILALIPVWAFADKVIVKHPEATYTPWFTGPLLAPSSLTVPPGHLDIEPYLYSTARTAFYNEHWKPVKMDTFWTFNFQCLAEFGLTSFMDIELIPIFIYNVTDGASSWALGDWELLVNFQLWSKIYSPDWTSAIKLTLIETFPTGKYNRLNPKKKFTDLGGQGSWQSSVGIVWGNQFHIKKHQFFNPRLALLFTYLTPIHVNGMSTWGGGPQTNGSVTPGVSLDVDLGMEYSLTQNWVLALDIVGFWQGKNKFTGFEGELPNHGIAQTGTSRVVQFSLAPAIEYNWSNNIGLIGGVWFTVAGRQSFQFTSGVVAFNYYH